MEQTKNLLPGVDPGDPLYARAYGQALFDLPVMQEQFQNLVRALTVDFPVIVAKFVASVAVSFTAGAHLGLRWRKWVTGKIANEYLADKAFYKIKHIYNNVDNPDPRMSEDIDNLTDGIITVGTQGVKSVLSVGLFLGLLLTFPNVNPAVLGGPDIEIKGYLFGAALFWAALGTGAIGAITATLPKIMRQKKATEGTFRAGLIAVNESAEQIALNNGEESEKQVLRHQFEDVTVIAKQEIKKKKNLLMVNSVLGNMGNTIPWIASAPLFFTGTVSLGQIGQAAQAFRSVENGLSFIQHILPRLGSGLIN